MRERGIIFNAEMVRAVLEGRKTQTRRIIKDCPTVQDGWYPDRYNNSDEWTFWGARGSSDAGRCTLPFVKCPFGEVGDRLWVRETWMPDAPRDGTWGDVEFYGCKGSPLSMIPKRFRKPENCIHRASWDGSEMVGWTPSIHMPRWASRITLEITGVRVERLQDISESDAVAEGIEPLPLEPDMPQFYHEYFPIGIKNGLRCNMSAAGSFSGLWEAIYGKESWQANPWVWVIEFKRVEGMHVQTS